MPIRLLAPATINRIAAGEVIERPAAAVKELVENALDAGAARIEVVLGGGGIEAIEVIDDGCGIAEDELALAIERHATSKLADEALVRIATLGFRGEALPSIGAVARLSIASRPPGARSGFRIAVEGGAVGAVSPVASPQGTRVRVEDLFFATPARRKFLRSKRAEGDEAERAVRRLAIAAPHVAFRLVSDQRVCFDLPAQEEAARVGALFGREAAGALLALDAEREGVGLAGLVGPATLTRATGALQSFVVNGRPVLDPLLRQALRIAYRDVIEPGRQPVAALRLSVPPEMLDVNVHPAKTELRFADGQGIRSLVIGAIGRALARPIALGAAPPALPLAAGRRPGGSYPAPGFAARPGPEARGFADAELGLGGWPAARTAMPVAGTDTGTDTGTGTNSGTGTGGAEFSPPGSAHPLGAPLAQILDTYILALAPDGALVLVDQHAAHERLTEERLKRELADGVVRAQALLMPVPVDLPASDASRLLAEAETLGRLGMEIEGFGPGAVLVRSVPAAIGTADPAELVRDLAEEFAESERALALEARLDAAIARMACHRSIRAGRRLAAGEMAALLRQMEATPYAATCSHGRPTFLKLTKGDLERLFGRR